MKLNEFKEHIAKFPEGKVFTYGISKPFSWRGSYDQVAFSILESPMTREEILANIELAYTKLFYGYKGGENRYNDYTEVNFEEGGFGSCSAGDYTSKMISKIENKEAYREQKERLVKIAFN